MIICEGLYFCRATLCTLSAPVRNDALLREQQITPHAEIDQQNWNGAAITFESNFSDGDRTGGGRGHNMTLPHFKLGSPFKFHSSLGSQGLVTVTV